MGNLDDDIGIGHRHLVFGNQLGSEDIIDWNFDHDDLTKPIYNITSENMKNMEFPIFDYDESNSDEDENEDTKDIQGTQDHDLNLSLISYNVSQNSFQDNSF